MLVSNNFIYTLNVPPTVMFDPERQDIIGTQTEIVLLLSLFEVVRCFIFPTAIFPCSLQSSHWMIVQLSLGVFWKTDSYVCVITEPINIFCNVKDLIIIGCAFFFFFFTSEWNVWWVKQLNFFSFFFYPLPAL